MAKIWKAMFGVISLFGCGGARSRGTVILAPLPGGGPLVTLLEAGTAPRRALRLAPAPATEALQVTIDDASQRSAHGETIAPPSNPERHRLDVTTTPGGYRLTFRAGGYVTPRAVRAGYTDSDAEQLAGVAGLATTATVTDRGETTWGPLEVPPAAPVGEDGTAQRVLDGLDRLLVALPEGPVGVGARWRVERNTHWHRAQVREILTATLTAADARGATITWHVVQRAVAGQELEEPGDPSVSTTLTDFGVDGSGSLELRFAQPWPRAAAARVVTRIAMRARTGSFVQTIVQRDAFTAELATLP